MNPMIVQGDALALPLGDESVDLVVTSPPYYGLRSYTDGGQHYEGQIGDEPSPTQYVDNLIRATEEMVRVLKQSGSIWVNLGDKYTTGGMNMYGSAPKKSLIGIPWRYVIRCIDELGLTLRAEVIWSKPNAMPESVTDRVRRTHETWFHLTRSPRYYAAVDEIRTPHVSDRTKPRIEGTDPASWGRGGKIGGVVNERHNTGNPRGSLPGSVWDMPTQPLDVPDTLGVDHYAAFPMAWPRRIIKAWCPPSGVVLDPFGGTGTTALVADVLGRQAIHVDMSSDYNRIATWRVSDPRQRARAAERTAGAVVVEQLPGQAELFPAAR